MPLGCVSTLKGLSSGSTVDTFQQRVLCYLPRDTLHPAQ